MRPLVTYLHAHRRLATALALGYWILVVVPHAQVADFSVWLFGSWTAVTVDGSLSAQFEHSLGVTADGCEIFTGSPTGLDRPPYGG